MKNKNLKGTLVLSTIAAGSILLGACMNAHAYADTINGQHVTLDSSQHKAIADDGTEWTLDGATWWHNTEGHESGVLAPDVPVIETPTPVTPTEPTEPPKPLPEQVTPPKPEEPTVEPTKPTEPPKQLPEQLTPTKQDTTEPTDEEKPTTGKTPAQVHDVKETTPTNKELNSNDIKKETTQTIKHEISNLDNAHGNQNRGSSAQPIAGSKGRSSGQTVKTVSKASDWKPSHLDRISADAEGKAAGVPLPATGDEDAVFAWAAGIFGIIAILAACTLALFNFKRYRKED